MEKRIFIAIILSIAFLWLWAAVAPRLFPELVRKPAPKTAAKTTTASPKTPATTTTAPAANPSGATLAPTTTPAAPVAATRAQNTVVETDKFVATFSNRGAQLVSFQLKQYKQKDEPTVPVELVKVREPHRTDYPFMLETRDAALSRRLNAALYAVTDTSDNRGTRVIEYRYAGADGVSVTKRFSFGPRPYLFDFSVAVQPAVPYRVTIGPGIRNLNRREIDTQVIITGNGVVQTEGDLEVIRRDKGDYVQVFPATDYIGIEDNYFLAAMRPAHGGDGVFRRLAQFDAKKERRDDLYASVNAATDGTVAGDAFFGPKETALLDSYGMGEALQLGWFGAIARFFLVALNWINQATHNYGWSIVVLTIIIKIVLYPLQHKSIVSMKKMQRVQPKVEQIKAKYKKSKSDPDQRQKMNVEMMQLYQKEGINPMAGCLPILLQLPILWGFYNLLSRAIELRGAPWMLWIRDLSEKDPTYILPILMTVTMFFQTYITPTAGDPAQRRIFLIMPFIFGFFFKDFPSGLVLYWLVQNVLTIIQQLIMNKWWKDHPAELQTA